MQLADVFCYIFLTITLTASCVAAEDQKNEIEVSKQEKRIVKREATVLVEDSFPMERVFQKPKVIYRRISKQRYGPPKPKYGPPKPKTRPPKSSRKPPTKKPRKPSAHFRYPLNSKKNSNKQKPRFGNKQRPSFGHVVKMPHYTFLNPDETSFGEPPLPYSGSSFQYPKQSYGEPPVDSYGEPVKANIKNILHSTPPNVQDATEFAINEFKQEYPSWQDDTDYQLSKKQPTFSAPNVPIYVTPEPKNFDEDPLDTVDDKQVLPDTKFFFRNKRPQYYSDSSKIVNRPWRPNKFQDFDDEIIVGGQYAEPPARVITKFQPNHPIYDDEDPSLFQAYANGEIVSSATNSPYTNYKNSNMAFSPQNLNDAFSIVDK